MKKITTKEIAHVLYMLAKFLVLGVLFMIIWNNSVYPIFMDKGITYVQALCLISLFTFAIREIKD